MRKSASRSQPFARRVTIPGRREGGDSRVPRSSRRGVAAAFLGRLRRLEVVVTYLCGVRKLSSKELDILLANMLELGKVEEPEAPTESGGREDDRDVVRVRSEREARDQVRGAFGRVRGTSESSEEVLDASEEDEDEP